MICQVLFDPQQECYGSELTIELVRATVIEPDMGNTASGSRGSVELWARTRLGTNR